MILPNHLSIARIILTPLFLILFLSGESYLMQISLAVYVIAAITDWYDGWLARKFNYITQTGKFLDPLADKILVSAAFFAFAYLEILEYWIRHNRLTYSQARNLVYSKGSGLVTAIMINE